MRAPTIAEVINEQNRAERAAAEKAAVEYHAPLGEVWGKPRDIEMYIYARGEMMLITSWRPQLWVATGSGLCTSSWCCHGGTPIYRKKS